MSQEPSEIQAIRLRVLRWMLYGLALLGLPSLVANAPSVLGMGFDLHVVLMGLTYLAVLVCALARERFPFGLRAGVVVVTLYGLGVYALVRFGLAGAGPLLMTTVAVLATVLFGLRSGLVFAAIATTSTALVGAGFATGVLVLSPLVPQSMSSAEAWVGGTAVVAMICLTLALAPGLLLRDLYRALNDREAANRQIAQEIASRTQLEVEKRELSEQLHQAQKMEAVGQLAGGIAHDFNNVLTAIRGNAELALAGVRFGSRTAGQLDACLRSVDRASELTGRLLAFSRGKVMELAPASLHDCLLGLEPMLRRLIGEEITLVVLPDAEHDAVMADANQIELALLNLVLNARDAMPQGGGLTIRTWNEAGDGPQPTVIVEVEDTGVGMDPATQGRIFEPFFTTKQQGRGTGLGLTMVFNIVQQHGGTIRVRSQLGAGTSIVVALQGCQARPAPIEPDRIPRSTPGGSEHVLLVEDDLMVLETTQAMLEELGYRVDVASTPDQALTFIDREPHPPDLLLTDVVLPGMNGRELAERILTRYPLLKVIFTSGYTDDDVLRRGVASEKVHFLAKPFSPGRLARKLREVLDAGDDFQDVTEEVSRFRQT